jgi:hypothetical protein
MTMVSTSWYDVELGIPGFLLRLLSRSRKRKKKKTLASRVFIKEKLRKRKVKRKNTFSTHVGASACASRGQEIEKRGQN